MRLSRNPSPLAAAALLAACTAGQGPSNAPPFASFTVQCDPLECRFTNASSDADGVIDSYAWDFGDASDPIATRDAVHTYDAPGRFIVRLTVTDDDGKAAAAVQEIVVAAPPGPEPAGRLLISNPVVAGAGEPAAYVSAPRGAFSGGRTAKIHNRRTGQLRSEVLVDGGLDPIAVPAAVGDSIVVEVQVAGAPPARIARTVPASEALTVVRSEPVVGATEVAVEASLVVVFSEPIDPSSVPAGLTLLSIDATRVPGAYAVSDGGLTATFTAAEALRHGSEYTIALSATLRAADGSGLPSPAFIPFRTAPSTEPRPDSFPPAPSGAAVYDRVSPSSFPGHLTRYLLFDDGTFSLQDVTPNSGVFEYTGRYTQAGASVNFLFDANNGRWRATGILQGDSLTVTYNLDMVLSDFENGVYRLAPNPDVLAFGGGDGDLYIVNLRGGLHRLTGGEHWDSGPVWSPDGTRLAFTRTIGDATPASETAIYVIAADGTGLRRLSAVGEDTHDEAPTWSPDGRWIAFHRKSAPDAGGDPYYQDKFEIYAMRADGTAPVRLTRHRSLSLLPAWSPDGTRIAYASWDFERFEWTLRVMNADGTGDARLTPGSYSRPAWSPDGARLVFGGWACPETGDPCQFGNSYLFTVNADGSRRRRLTDSALQEFGHTAWSSDGRLIAFTPELACQPGCGTGPIDILRLEDGEIISLAGTTGASMPSWRP